LDALFVTQDSFVASLELPEVDGSDFRMPAQEPGDTLEKRRMFHDAGFPEPSVNLVETRINIPGMAYQFPGAGGHGCEQ
jgi:hypothetical protein